MNVVKYSLRPPRIYFILRVEEGIQVNVSGSEEAECSEETKTGEIGAGISFPCLHPLPFLKRRQMGFPSSTNSIE